MSIKKINVRFPTVYPTWEYKITPLREHAQIRVLDSPDACAQYFREIIVSSEIYRPESENLVVVVVNTRRRAKGFHIISVGTLDTLLVHPREVFRIPLMLCAAAIILVHNHPSGDPTPSEADVKVTRDLVRGGQLLKLEVLDHLIMGDAAVTGGRDYTSLRELGFFYA